MTLFKWFPWRWIVSRTARSRGFMDPLEILARARRFAQPSEVKEPVELLRAGMVFHARGLMNTRAIQHNLDWVWPYWVHEQFDPRSESFMPRAFSLTHVNLTHRNWTAVGMEGFDEYPLVDPRGLLTPLFDGWSLDTWIISKDGEKRLLPSQESWVDQRLRISEGRGQVRTYLNAGWARLSLRAELRNGRLGPVCQLRAIGTADRPAWLVLAVRPTNPEGVSFVDEVKRESAQEVVINGRDRLRFDSPAERIVMSTYAEGDVEHDLTERDVRSEVECEIGLASAAAMFSMNEGEAEAVLGEVLLGDGRDGERVESVKARTSEREEKQGEVCQMSVPEERYRFLHTASAHTLKLLTPEEAYPGPYTYKRFWYRDAVFMLWSLLGLGEIDVVRRAMRRFPDRQDVSGYYHSQEGEWDSNGQVLWLFDQFERLTGERIDDSLLQGMLRGGRWIMRKTVKGDSGKPHAGLLPAGFSAEHLGPNDYYYWDDFWAVAGLRATASVLARRGRGSETAEFLEGAERLTRAIERSLEVTQGRRKLPGVPASCYRRMDSGAVGSLVAGYPLQLWAAQDPGLLATAEFLLDNCMIDDGFFHDQIHSGINPYLTLHLAQVLLRGGDTRGLRLTDAVAVLASPTGQWPEAVHPRTHGGCMGDGQHAWAAAEWIRMMRHMFVREEDEGVVLCSGLQPRWMETGIEMSYGPTPTPWGPMTVSMVCEDGQARVNWDIKYRGESQPAKVLVRPPGYEPAQVSAETQEVALSMEVVDAGVAR